MELLVLEREKGDEKQNKNKPDMDSIPIVPVYILLVSRFPPLRNPYHFTADVRGRTHDLIEVRIGYTSEDFLRGLIR